MATKELTPEAEALKRARADKADQRARDAQEAWKEHSAQAAHLESNTARLRALRLASEAEAAIAKDAAKAAKKPAKKAAAKKKA